VLAEFFFKIQLRLEIALSCFANFKQGTIHGANIQNSVKTTVFRQKKVKEIKKCVTHCIICSAIMRGL